MYKVQLTFTPQEVNILASKASQLGYSVTKYIKLLISRETLSLIEKYPVLPMSKKTERKVMQAIKEHKEGKTLRISSFQELDKA